MLTNINDYPTLKAKQHTRLAGKSNKLSTPLYSWDFKIQEPDVQETYHANDNTLIYNDRNAYVVDWEMPK